MRSHTATDEVTVQRVPFGSFLCIGTLMGLGSGLVCAPFFLLLSYLAPSARLGLFIVTFEGVTAGYVGLIAVPAMFAAVGTFAAMLGYPFFTWWSGRSSGLPMLIARSGVQKNGPDSGTGLPELELRS